MHRPHLLLDAIVHLDRVVQLRRLCHLLLLVQCYVRQKRAVVAWVPILRQNNQVKGHRLAQGVDDGHNILPVFAGRAVTQRKAAR